MRSPTNDILCFLHTRNSSSRRTASDGCRREQREESMIGPAAEKRKHQLGCLSRRSIPTAVEAWWNQPRIALIRKVRNIPFSQPAFMRLHRLFDYQQFQNHWVPILFYSARISPTESRTMTLSPIMSATQLVPSCALFFYTFSIVTSF